MKKGIILMALMACMTAVLFAGGGQSAGTTGGKVTITVWSQDRGPEPVIEPLRVKYNETNRDNIYLEQSRMFGDDFYQAIELTVQTGGEGLPDIFAEAAVNCFGSTMHQQGWFLDLGPWLETHTTAADQEFKRMYGSYQIPGQTVYDGLWIKAGVNVNTPQRLMWNREIFKKAGLPDRAPESLEEMVQFARQITTNLKGEGIYGFAMNMKNPSSAYYRSLFPQLSITTGKINGGLDNATGKYDYISEELWQVLEAWQQLLAPDIVFPGTESLDIDPLRAQFADGKIGMYISYGFDPMVYQPGAQFPTTIDYSLAKIPVPGGNYKSRLGGSISGRNIINARSAHLEEAWIVLRDFFYGVDTLAALVTASVVNTPIPEINAKATRPAFQINNPYANWQDDIDQFNGLPLSVGPWSYEGAQEVAVFDEIIQKRLGRTEAMALLRDLADRQNKGTQDSIDRGEHTRYLARNYDPMDFSKYTLGPEMPKSR
jgi:multiple sugar transport system substrate-binding protein